MDLKTVAIVSRALSEIGLTATRAVILHASSQEAPISMTEIARATNISSAGLTGAVDALEKIGYVTRAHDTADRRKILVRSTKDGVNCLVQVVNLAKSIKL